MVKRRSTQKKIKKSGQIGIESKQALLLKEFEQAWQHYRHIEIARNTFFGFCLTIIIATVGFALTGSKGLLNPNEVMFFGIFIFSTLISVTLVYMAAAIYKQDYLLRFYSGVWNAIREKYYGDEYAYLKAKFDVYAQNHRILKDKKFSHQFCITLLIVIFIVLLTVAEIALWVHYCVLHMFSCYYYVIALGLVLTPIVIGTVILKSYWLYRKRQSFDDLHKHCTRLSR